MPLVLKIEPADEVVRAYIAKHPLEFCRPRIIPKEFDSTKRAKQELFAEPDILKAKEESIEDLGEEVSAKAVTQMRENACQQISNDGLGLTGAMGSFSLGPRTNATTNDTTTNGLTNPMGSFSLAPKTTSPPGSRPAPASASPTPHHHRTTNKA